MNTSKVTRLEVVDLKKNADPKGRVYINWHRNNKIELSLQDDGRTLKIFIQD